VSFSQASNPDTEFYEEKEEMVAMPTFLLEVESTICEHLSNHDPVGVLPQKKLGRYSFSGQTNSHYKWHTQ